MAQQKPLTVNVGELQQLQAGDTLAVGDALHLTDAANVEILDTLIMTTGGPIPEIMFDVNGTVMIYCDVR